MTFEEHDPDVSRSEPGWENLPAPRHTVCYIAQNWADAEVVSANPQTGAVRVVWPPGSTHHRELDASHHRGIRDGRGSVVLRGTAPTRPPSARR